MHCPNTSSNEWKELVSQVGEKEAWRNFLKYGEVRQDISPESSVFKSIATRSTEDIAEGIDRNLIRTQQEIKYTNYIQALTLDAIGEISPNKVIQTSMASAFDKAKAKFETALKNSNDFIAIVKTPEIFNDLKQKDEAKLNALIDRLSLQGVKSFEDVVRASTQYSSIIDNFEKYKDFVRAELARLGIREVKGNIEMVQSEDVTNKEADDTEDHLLAQEEIGERFGVSANEVNPRDTASMQVRSLMRNIKIPGKFELGIPMYANPDDVFQDVLNAGVDMRLSGYTDTNNKYEAFKTSLQQNVEARPYLAELINKLENFKKAGRWDTINQVLTFASKAFANETLVLYKASRSGGEVNGITDVKVININRDTVEEQVSREWYAQQLNSGFFTKSLTGELFPDPVRVERLGTILKEGRDVKGDAKIKKFQEFFDTLGIKLSDKDMEFIAPRLGAEIKRGRAFDSVFANKGMLENIYMGYMNNLENPFMSNYGLQNEKSSMGKLARLYYEANPGLISVPAARAADGKQKHLFVQPSFTEIRKRQWETGDTSSLMNSALALPNKEFWSDVKNDLKKFSLDYFNGMREQESGREGKTRKNLTDAEQIRAMFMKHQENLNTGTYVIFTLSDKTSSIETKMTKEFFVDDKNIPVGKGTDFTLDKDGNIQYTPLLKEKIYNTFVEPEISRILAAMQHSKQVNLENFDLASKLFYFIPDINSNPLLESFRKDLYSGTMSLEDIKNAHSKTVGAVVLRTMMDSVEENIDQYVSKGVIKNVNGTWSFPSFKTGFKQNDYLNRFRKTEAQGRNLARLMVMDMKLNYMNAQVKTIQFLRFDPMVAFKMPKTVEKKPFADLKGADKVKIANATWDEFSKRAAALIAPGGQGSWSWMLSNGERYFSKEYKAITAEDESRVVNKIKSDIADAQEFTTVREHIDYLMSEGKLPLSVWESIDAKIRKAGPGGFYKLSGEEMKYVFTPLKPVHVNDVNEGENTGLNRIDYVKSSRYPLIPEHEANSERDKLRVWMEQNDISSVNFASAKKLGRPAESVRFFDDKGNFVEPTKEAAEKATQILSRDGLRTQQEIPHQKDEIATVSQMNRTLFDNLLESKFDFPGLGTISGAEFKTIKERVRTRMFAMKAAEMDEELGNLELSHQGIYNLLKETILNDSTGSYGENDLRALMINPATGKFLMPLEFNFKAKKIQGLINSMINKNVMLKMNGSSFVQVSGVGSKFNFSSLSEGIKSNIIWTDSFAKTFKDGEAKLSYISKTEDGKVKPAQVIVSQYIKDEKGKLVDLSKFIKEENGVKILDTSKIDPSLLQLVASRIPNQSHVSMLPIEVVGFLPSYMEDTIIVPDGITGQMGSDFDVDKLYAYKSKTEAIRNESGDIVGYKPISYSISSLADIDTLGEEQLKQFYRDIHWNVLTHPDTYSQITKSIDNPEVGAKKQLREEALKKYNVTTDTGTNLPLDFNTSVNRFNDNRSGKDGVSIFANLISAQADFQDKPLKLGNVVEGEEVPKPIYIKIGNEVLAFEYLGQTGTSTSFLGKKKSVSDNLNIPFGESVDNAKNLNLREFNWDKKAMTAVGVLNMLTTADRKAIPIEFSMDLTSQPIIYKLFESIDKKQDAFGKFQSDAFNKSVEELQDTVASLIDTGEYLKGGKKAKEYLEDANRDRVLDPKKLELMWLVGKMVTDKNMLFGAKTQEEALAKGQDLSGIKDNDLFRVVKDNGYKSVNDLLLDYYTTQYDSIDLFSRLNGIGTELMTILGSVYTYTKGIGPDVFTTKQKLNQLNKLAGSSNFLGISKIAGDVYKNDHGVISILPEGEIGHSIYYSLIKAQSIYQSLFPISTGVFLENFVDTLLNDKGIKKEDLGRQAYIDVHQDVFNAIKSYMYTIQDLELFGEPTEIRNRLINGDTSLGKTILDLKETPEFSRNGFLKNIEVSKQYNGDAYTLSFKAPFGTDLDEKSILSGFYELATSDNEVLREVARDLAIYPFATGDAGNIGRFIPVDYYMSDDDFRSAIEDMYDTYNDHMKIADGINTIKDQLVQNNPEAYSVKFDYSFNFKKEFQKIVGGAVNLQGVNKFNLKLGDFQTESIQNNLKVPLNAQESLMAAELKVSTNFKYPGYLLLSDPIYDDFSGDEIGSKNYLYKRTSDAVTSDGIATYERLNILGYKNIKEYDYGNIKLSSVIKENQVDVSTSEEFAPPFIQDEGFGLSFGSEEEQDEFSAPLEEKPAQPSTQATREYTPEKLTKENMPENGIFVFGSNTEGRHGRGAAQDAGVNFGAIQGQAEGLQGKSYAIITKDLSKGERSIPLYDLEGTSIADGVRDFVEFANAHPELKFYVTKLGSKLAGYTVEEIKGVFKAVNDLYLSQDIKNYIPNNVILPREYEVRDDISKNEEGEEGSKESIRTTYGGRGFILEGSPEDGYQIWYESKGGKGKLLEDHNLGYKVALTYEMEAYPERVVTLSDMPNSPRYFVELAGEVISLQDSTFGKQITDTKLVNKIHQVLFNKSEVSPEEEAFAQEVASKQFDQQTGKRINVPEGSNPNNMVIFETADTKYLMNDGQQEAYDYIKGTVERLLKERKNIRPTDLENTQSFLDPLTQKFNGVIPKAMWDHMIGLAGRGGVGKTTVIKAIMDSLNTGNKYRSANVMYLTPSHTAATVLQESLGLDSEKANDGTVNTIQSAVRRNQIDKSGNLQMQPTEEYLRGLKFKPAFSSPDIIVVDESSMITIENINDMMARTKTDLAHGHTNKMPIFIFMGDYRQLGPINEQQNPDVNKGIISSTLLLNKEKTKELTQVMRSDNKNLHQIFDSIGSEIIENIERTQKGQKAKQLSFDNYDKLTSQSSENILVVDNVKGVIDDYTDYLKDNNNPYGMFWVHYNRVENPTTVTLSDSIRKEYFQKIGKTIESVPHRTFSNGDYIEFTGNLEIDGAKIQYDASNNRELARMLDERKTNTTEDGRYRISGGTIKPRSRYKVMDIVKTKKSIKDILPGSLHGYLNNQNQEVQIEEILIYNRQNNIRAYSKALGITIDFGTYNSRSKQQEGITIREKESGAIIAKFSLFYGDFKSVQGALELLNDKSKMPFTPSYIGSSHTAQGNSIKNVIVGDYNIKQNRSNPKINQDDIFSSMYVGLTRTSGTLTIIKPRGANIASNQEVYKGAITDDGKKRTEPVNSVKPSTGEFQTITPQTAIVEPFGGDETVDPLELFLRSNADEALQATMDALFKGQDVITDYKQLMNSIYKNASDFNKKLITAIAKSGAISPFTVVIDNNMADPGKYNNYTKTITINPKKAVGDSTSNQEITEKLHQVIMHEIMHHLTSDLLNAKPDTLTAEQRKWVDALKNVFDAVQRKMLSDPNHRDALQRAIDQVKNDGYLSAADKSQYYGLTNVHDFVSMLMTDQGFQDFMNNTTYEGQKSIFEKFLDMLGDLLRTLGINVKDNSVLKEGVTDIMGLIQSRNSKEGELKSISTVDIKKENIDNNFNNIIKFLEIKTKC